MLSQCIKEVDPSIQESQPYLAYTVVNTTSELVDLWLGNPDPTLVQGVSVEATRSLVGALSSSLRLIIANRENDTAAAALAAAAAPNQAALRAKATRDAAQTAEMVFQKLMFAVARSENDTVVAEGGLAFTRHRARATNTDAATPMSIMTYGLDVANVGAGAGLLPPLSSSSSSSSSSRLAPPSVVTILPGGLDVATGVDVFVTQYSDRLNPYAKNATSDVVSVRIDSRIDSVTSPRARGATRRGRQLLPLPTAVAADKTTTATPTTTTLRLDFTIVPSANESTVDDDCKTVYRVGANASGREAEKFRQALSSSCAKWNGTAFVPLDGCILLNASFSGDGASGSSTILSKTITSTDDISSLVPPSNTDSTTASTEWNLQCECTVQLGESEGGSSSADAGEEGNTFAIVDYTFDQLGRAFHPSTLVKVSVVPVLVAAIPVILELLALFAVECWWRCRARGARGKRIRARTGNDGEAPAQGRRTEGKEGKEGNEEKESTTLATDREEQSHSSTGEAFTTGRRFGGARPVGARLGGLSHSWHQMKDSHEVLAICCARRRPGCGVSTRIVIFVCALEAQVMSVTVMFWLYSCYSMTSVFEDGELNTGTWVFNRVVMLALASMLTFPLKVTMKLLFLLNRMRAENQTIDLSCCYCCFGGGGGGGGGVGGGALRRRARHNGKCRLMTCLPWWFAMVPWCFAAIQTAVFAFTIALATASNEGSLSISDALVQDFTAGGGFLNGPSDWAKSLPCHCRVSHTEYQTDQWLSMVAMQLLFWIFLTTPASIVVFAMSPRAMKTIRSNLCGPCKSEQNTQSQQGTGDDGNGDADSGDWSGAVRVGVAGEGRGGGLEMSTNPIFRRSPKNSIERGDRGRGGSGDMEGGGAGGIGDSGRMQPEPSWADAALATPSERAQSAHFDSVRSSMGRSSDAPETALAAPSGRGHHSRMSAHFDSVTSSMGRSSDAPSNGSFDAASTRSLGGYGGKNDVVNSGTTREQVPGTNATAAAAAAAAAAEQKKKRSGRMVQHASSRIAEEEDTFDTFDDFDGKPASSKEEEATLRDPKRPDSKQLSTREIVDGHRLTQKARRRTSVKKNITWRPESHQLAQPTEGGLSGLGGEQGGESSAGDGGEGGEDWDCLKDDATGCYYWHHKETGESQWVTTESQ
jgi:hypothetical protein